MPRSSDARPIAVFDSGVGGLTVLSEIHRRLPRESTVYLGDNARAPYGPRPAEEVRRYTLECLDWLLAADPKVVVLACNTASAQALDDVRASSAVPVMGVIRPGAVAAAAATRSGQVGVVATAGTVRSEAYPAAIAEADPQVRVVQQACPDLVPLVESGQIAGRAVEDAVAGYLGALLERAPNIDTLLLGCTHYPPLRPVFSRALGDGVAVVDSAFTTALALEDLLDALRARAPAGTPTSRIATTGAVEAFEVVAARVFGAGLPAVEAASVGSH